MKCEERITELGAERRCKDCGEFWELTREFFYPYRGGFYWLCKVCFKERREKSFLKRKLRLYNKLCGTQPLTA